MKYFVDKNISILDSKALSFFKKSNALSLFRDIDIFIATYSPIDNTQQYNKLVFGIIKICKNHSVKLKYNNPLHYKELVIIEQNKPLTEKTLWGGVSLKKVDVEKDFVQKLLVVNQYGILGFEIHKRKHEKLKVLEGIVIVLYSNHKKIGWKNGLLNIQIGLPESKFEFVPNDEHGIIALTNAVIEETSTNHLDDLVYVFRSKQIN